MESSTSDQVTPPEVSFFKYARMETLSEEAIKRLQECCFRQDEFGSELCQLFHSLVLYYNMQTRLEKPCDVSIANPPKDESEKASRDVNGECCSWKIPAPVTNATEENVDRKMEEAAEINHADGDSDFEEGEVIDTEDEVESNADLSTEEGEIDNGDESKDDSKDEAKSEQNRHQEQVSSTKTAIEKRTAMMMEGLREYEESASTEDHITVGCER
ncbi:hypothetical protein PMAYCL1PPCAC_33071 [Pristionchus mayeri]|uniref:Uncharacterized protein n=1 Tax=Pristionchus mayeri TaxID=1317129 RepID=A0AAN5DH43_9BILA|nr:hypothetical protein PMAYCL1PPCAC_33071 [Pristionchus mayeri]